MGEGENDGEKWENKEEGKEEGKEETICILHTTGKTSGRGG
jgi:hypothetical protein